MKCIDEGSSRDSCPVRAKELQLRQAAGQVSHARVAFARVIQADGGEARQLCKHVDGRWGEVQPGVAAHIEALQRGGGAHSRRQGTT